MPQQANNSEFYKHLFHATGEGMIVVDGKGTIVLANDRILELFGYAEDELIGSPLKVLIPTKHKAHHDGHVKGFFAAPKKRLMSQSMTLSGLKKDGTEFPLEVSLNHFETPTGTFAIGLVTDITERKEAERKIHELNDQLETKVKERTAQLAESERLYSTIASNFPEGIIAVLDLEFDYIFAEGEELRKRGLTPEDLSGVSFIHSLPKQSKTTAENALKKVKEGMNQTFELSLFNQYFELDAVPLKAEDGEVEQVLIIERNITKKKEAENEMINTLEKERELNSLKSRFVSMASHEFRTPLAAILSSVSLISKYTTEEQQPKRDKHISRIKSSVQNLTIILNDFLSLDKLEAGKVICLPEPFLLQKMCELVIDDISSLLKTNQKIAFDNGTEGLNVTWDRNLSRNILTNLLSNAIKYSDEGATVHFSTAVSDKDIVVTVKDEGIGIPEEEQSLMFERFFRAKNATNLQGTGLGLNITKKHVELMGGTIAFSSVANEGSTFIVTLPQNCDQL